MKIRIKKKNDIIRLKPRDFYGFFSNREDWHLLKRGEVISVNTPLSEQEFLEKYSEFEIVRKEEKEKFTRFKKDESEVND